MICFWKEKKVELEEESKSLVAEKEAALRELPSLSAAKMESDEWLVGFWNSSNVWIVA